MDKKPTATFTKYKSSYIVDFGDRVQLVDIATGRWMPAKSVRLAKWTATVWARLNSEFHPDSEAPQAQRDVFPLRGKALCDYLDSRDPRLYAQLCEDSASDDEFLSAAVRLYAQEQAARGIRGM